MKSIYCAFILLPDMSTNFCLVEKDAITNMLHGYNVNDAHLYISTLNKDSRIITDNGTIIHIKPLNEESRRDMLNTLNYADESPYSNVSIVSIPANSPLLTEDFVKELPAMCTPEYRDMNESLQEDIYSIDTDTYPNDAFIEKHKDVLDRIEHVCKMNDAGYYRIEYVIIPEAEG